MIASFSQQPQRHPDVMRNPDTKGKSLSGAIGPAIIGFVLGGFGAVGLVVSVIPTGGDGYLFGFFLLFGVGVVFGAVLGAILGVIIYSSYHFGAWVYESDAECSQTRVCQWCGVHSRRVEHDVPHWDIPVFHGSSTWRFGPWGTEESGLCTRCQQVQRSKTSIHDD